MKRIYKILALSTLVFTASSCKKYLDINANPNEATSSTPALTLANAQVVTGANLVTYNTYGATVDGMAVNAGGFGGFGSLFTYAYANNENTGLWTSVYDNVEDYQYVIDQTAGKTDQEQFHAVANVMKSYNMQMLVDLYGDVPYTDAFKGLANLAPKYDSAPVIYQSLITNLDDAITELKAHPTATSQFPGGDLMFHGDITSWIKFAQTVKLRLLIRIQGVTSLASFISAEFAKFDTATGFITTDVTVQPGYIVTDGKQNPMWNTYVANAAGTPSQTGRVYIPGLFAYGFYSGVKLTDNDRGVLTYRSFPSTPVGQLGSPNNPTAPTTYPAWYTGASLGNTTGILKGATAAKVIMFASESYFLQAEANLKGRLSGSALSNFESGIKSSYEYLSKDVNGAAGSVSSATFLTNYKAANPGTNAQGNQTAYGYLVNYSSATSDAQRLEAIITQKYIANNFVFGAEAWAEFRRTGYPTSLASSSNAGLSIVSTSSTSTRTDRLPVRLPYPDTEYQLNTQNVPAGISIFNSPIFWDVN